MTFKKTRRVTSGAGITTTLQPCLRTELSTTTIGSDILQSVADR